MITFEYSHYPSSQIENEKKFNRTYGSTGLLANNKRPAVFSGGFPVDGC